MKLLLDTNYDKSSNISTEITMVHNTIILGYKWSCFTRGNMLRIVSANISVISALLFSVCLFLFLLLLFSYRLIYLYYNTDYFSGIKFIRYFTKPFTYEILLCMELFCFVLFCLFVVVVSCVCVLFIF